ncbi:MAG: type II toxin-antitoxin system RelE/ParE family toxin [Rhodospirillales bacterium]
MRVFLTKPFQRFAAREDIDDVVLCAAALRIRADLADADLGGGVIKQRVMRKGQGKSGGYRVVVLFRRGSNAFFVYGFAKSDRDDIRPDELKAFRGLANHVLAMDGAALSAATGSGALKEIECHG